MDMWKTKQVSDGDYDEEKGRGGSNSTNSNSPPVVGLLVTIIVLLLCVFATVVVLGIGLMIQSKSEETKDMLTMAHDMKTFMPQIKTFLPKVATVVEGEGNGFNVTKLMHKLNEFDTLTDDLKILMPHVKTLMPAITTLVASDKFNVTKLVQQLNDFDTVAEDMKKFAPDIKKAMDALGDSDISKIVKELDGVGNVIEKIKKDPLGLLLDGAFEANTDMSRWRALGLQGANVLEKLSKVDYSVKLTTPFKFDVIQDCEGKFNAGFQGDDQDKYKTDSASSCKNFSSSVVASEGYGTCKWRNKIYMGRVTGEGDCEDGKEGEDDSYRWIRNVRGASGDIIPKSTSDSLQQHFSKLQNAVSDFIGNSSEIPELKPAASIDFPMYISNLLGAVTPSMLQNVADATEFLETKSISKITCEPIGGKEDKNSCKWVEEGYKSALDSGFKTGLYIVRTMSKNIHKVWSS